MPRLLTTVLTIPVAIFVAVIVTPGSKAPVASATVPPTVALLVCAKTSVARTTQSSIVLATQIFFMISSSHGRNHKPATPVYARGESKSGLAMFGGEFRPVHQSCQGNALISRYRWAEAALLVHNSVWSQV